MPLTDITDGNSPMGDESLEEILEAISMQPTEKLLAKSLLDRHSDCIQLSSFEYLSLFIALASIFASIRRGHLGVYFQSQASAGDNFSLFPSVEVLWKAAKSCSYIETLLGEGFKKLSQCSELLEIECIHGIWTLKSQLGLEKEVAMGLKTLMDLPFRETSNRPPFDEADFANLHHAQRLAVETATRSSFMVITGGPGTGKTHTIEKVIRALNPKRCLLLAPTGKAALQLQNRFVMNSFSSMHLKVATIHRVLGLGVKKKRPVPIEADCIIVDESSMIDLYLMRIFLQALPKDATIIFVGDPKQLPSVESGSLFADLVTYMQRHRPHLLIELTQVFRTDEPKILNLNRAIQNGEITFFDHLQELQLLQLSEMPSHGAFYLIDESISSLIDAYYNRVHRGLHMDLKSALEFWSHVRLLCPLKRGLEGSNALNRALVEKAHIDHKAISAPVIVSKAKGPFVNGQLGVIEIDIESMRAKEAVFEGDNTIYSDVELPPFELAFCLTVHKTQGSEFDAVFLAFPEGCEYFGREALYTAVTRVKKQLILWGKRELLEEAVKHKTERIGLISHFLEDELLSHQETPQ